MSQLTLLPPPSACPALIVASGERAQFRFLEFFASNIRNPGFQEQRNRKPR